MRKTLSMKFRYSISGYSTISSEIGVLKVLFKKTKNLVLPIPETSFGNLGYCAVMAKSKNHAIYNQSQKRHKKLLIKL